MYLNDYLDGGKIYTRVHVCCVGQSVHALIWILEYLINSLNEMNTNVTVGNTGYRTYNLALERLCVAVKRWTAA